MSALRIRLRRKTARKKAARRKKKSARGKTARRKVTRKKVRRKATARKKVARKKRTGATRKKATRRKARKKVARKKKARKKAKRKTARKPKRARSEAPRAPTTRPAGPSPLHGPGRGGWARATAPAPSQRLGVVTHYYPRVEAGIVAVERELRTGDTVHFLGHTTDFYQRIDRIELDHQPIEVARPGQVVGIKVGQRVRDNDEVLLVSR